MALQSADLKKCLSCQRWGGGRRLAAEPGMIEFDESEPKGLCNEGPWHGSLRSVRNACGRWQRWEALTPEAVASGLATATNEP